MGDSTLITYLLEQQREKIACSAAPTQGIAHMFVQCACNCPQADSAKLLIIRLKITKSNDSSLIRDNLLPGTPVWLYSSNFLSCALISHLLCLLCIYSNSLSPFFASTPGAAAGRMTSPPWIVDCGVWKTKWVCVFLCTRRQGNSSNSILTTNIPCNGGLHITDRNFYRRSIVFVFVCVCVDSEWDQCECLHMRFQKYDPMCRM